MLFSSIAIKTSIPATAPAATSGAFSVSSIDSENWLQITGEASAGAGSLYLLRWNATLEEWRIYMEDRPIVVDSSALGGFFSAAYPFPKLDTLDLRLEPGDVLAVALQTASSTATADVSLNWHEE